MPIRLVSGATATTSPPSAATDGFPLRGNASGVAGMWWQGEDAGLVAVRSTAGSGTMNVTVRLWGYVEFDMPTGTTIAFWVPMGPAATDAARGCLNGGVAIGEMTTPADTLRHSEIVTGLCGFKRIYAEVVAINGTSTAVDVFLLSIEEG